MVHLADVSRSHLYKCATIKEHHSQVYTCQPIQFTSIEYIFVISGGRGGGIWPYWKMDTGKQNFHEILFCFKLSKKIQKLSKEQPTHALAKWTLTAWPSAVNLVRSEIWSRACVFCTTLLLPSTATHASWNSKCHCHQRKKQKTPAYIREIQVYRLWTKAYSQKGLTAMQANLHKWLSQSMSLSHSRLQSSATRASGQFIV